MRVQTAACVMLGKEMLGVEGAMSYCELDAKEQGAYSGVGVHALQK